MACTALATSARHAIVPSLHATSHAPSNAARSTGARARSSAAIASGIDALEGSLRARLAS
eukprot:30894-Pelagococcus_subviridis.AAC.9